MRSIIIFKSEKFSCQIRKIFLMSFLLIVLHTSLVEYDGCYIMN